VLHSLLANKMQQASDVRYALTEFWGEVVTSGYFHRKAVLSTLDELGRLYTSLGDLQTRPANKTSPQKIHTPGWQLPHTQLNYMYGQHSGVRRFVIQWGIYKQHHNSRPHHHELRCHALRLQIRLACML
jgi:hypothetical protein